MSEIFDMQEDGILCAQCSAYVGPATGYMRKCDGCRRQGGPDKRRRRRGLAHKRQKDSTRRQQE
jgi:hypothetical protein